MLQHYLPIPEIDPRPRTRKKSLFYFGCDFSGWYNFGKIIKTVVTRCHILKLKCTKFDFDWSSAPDPLRELTALPRPLSWI